MAYMKKLYHEDKRYPVKWEKQGKAETQTVGTASSVLLSTRR
jgi:hypothetical protein